MFAEKRAKITWSWLKAQCLTRAFEKPYLLSDEEELPGLGIRKLSLYALFHVSFWKRSAHADNELIKLSHSGGHLHLPLVPRHRALFPTSMP